MSRTHVVAAVFFGLAALAAVLGIVASQSHGHALAPKPTSFGTGATYLTDTPLLEDSMMVDANKANTLTWPGRVTSVDCTSVDVVVHQYRCIYHWSATSSTTVASVTVSKDGYHYTERFPNLK